MEKLITKRNKNTSRKSRLSILSSSDSIFLNPWFLLSTVTLAFLLFFCLPPLLNFLKPFLRPKNTWISLNNFLLLFAIVSGALSNHKDDEDDDRSISASHQIGFLSSSASFSSFLEHPIHQDPVKIAEMEFSSNLVRLITSRSCPDRRREPSDDLWRFSDHIHANCTCNSSRRSNQHHRCSCHRRKEEEASSSRGIPIDKLVKKKNKACKTLPRIAKNDDLEKLQQKKSRKKSGAEKDIARALAHLDKKKKQKSRHNYDTDLLSPPPPPPPTSVFYKLFKKSCKRKSVHFIRHPPPPPPLHLTKAAFPPPSLATEIVSDGEDDDHGLNIGSESPLSPLPLPPPPPPFQLQKLKFRVHGGFVPVSSGLSDSSDTENNDEIPIWGTKESRPFFPSIFRRTPEVDTRADAFIARFREKLRLENINSSNKA